MHHIQSRRSYQEAKKEGEEMNSKQVLAIVSDRLLKIGEIEDEEGWCLTRVDSRLYAFLDKSNGQEWLLNQGDNGKFHIS